MSKTSAPPPQAFEPAFIAGLKAIFEEKIVFNQVLGLKITSLRPDGVAGRIDMKPELVGHYAYNRVHGGVISAGLDAMGGLAVMATIDLRIDYQRPGIGSHFELRAEVLRLGSRVATTRMEFLGPDGQIMSAGAAAYIVS